MRLVIAAAALGLPQAALTHARAAPSARQRPWTPMDSIGVRYIVMSPSTPGVPGQDGNPVQVSPDGRHFFFTVTRGDLSCDCNRYTLYVFSTDAIRQALDAGSTRPPQPLATVEKASAESDVFRQGIHQPRWNRAGHISFICQADAPRQLCDLDLATGRSTTLTTGPNMVGTYQANGDQYLYVRYRNIPRPGPSYPMQPVQPHFFPGGIPVTTEIEIVRLAEGHSRVLAQAGEQPGQPSIARDGRHLIIALRDGQGESAARALFLIESRSGARRRLAAIAARQPPAISWSDDGRRVTVNGQIVDLPPPAEDAPPPSGSLGDLVVEVRENANLPPVVMVRRGTRELALLGPDPALAQPERRPVERFSWIGPDRRQLEAGLVMPARRTGARTPLVILAYRFAPDRFLPDGPHTTADAMQALAAAGFAVLTLELPMFDDPTRIMEREGASFVARLDSAVAALVADRSIDPARVGLIGFSRGGYNALYAVTHPGATRLAAAIVADGFSGSYGGYALTLARGSDDFILSNYGAVNGGAPVFWRNKESWLREAPGFNVERIETPLLLTAMGQGYLQYAEFAAGLGLMGRPFDLLVFPDGAHTLQRPRERLAAMHASVDWMKLWLLGDATLSNQDPLLRARWRALREGQMGSRP